jgi:hypothetical protein
MNPDTWIIDRLEAAMARSPVSPFAVARFFAAGHTVAFVIAAGSDRHTIGLCLATLCIITLPSRYRAISRLERESARGLLNSSKPEWRWRLSFMTMALLILGCVAAGDHSVTGFAQLAFSTLLTAESYFSALNWTPPPPKYAPGRVETEWFA